MKNIKNTKGFTLIEAVLAIGTTAILIGIISNIIFQYNKELTGLSEKLVVRSTEIQLISTLMNESHCGCLFRGNTFDQKNKVWSNPLKSISSGYEFPIPASPTPCTPLPDDLIPAVGGKLGGEYIRVSEIGIKKIVMLGAGKYLGQVEVEVDPNTVVSALRKIQVPVTFSIDCANGAFLSCSAAGVSTPDITQTPVSVGPDFSSGTAPILTAWQENAEDLDCPQGSVVTGFSVNTGGNVNTITNSSAPLIQSVKIKCSAVE